jgi:hypothetical protein
MVETFTPAVCGGRRRQRLALAGFAVGALTASALVGAALGGLGALVGAALALPVAGLALLGAAREAGLLRVPLPQVRRQVPERWRAELPLPAWSVGYGAGLGAGFLTFQPVATFWVAAAAAVALARPLPAAACFAAYGAGRTLMAASARRGHPDASAAVEALARRRRLLLRVNVVALIVCAALLAAPAAGAATSIGRGFDPAAAGGVLARARIDAGSRTVIVKAQGEDAVAFAGAAAPAVDGDLLAYGDAEGIRVVDWRTRTLVARVDGAVAKPALDWPLLAFVRTSADDKRLIVADFADPASPTERTVASTLSRNDLGRPALEAGRVAWHKITRKESRVLVENLASGRRRTIAHSEMYVESNPSLTGTRILWVEARPKSALLRVRRLDRAGTRTLYKVTGRDRRLWTTALAGRTAYVARWRPSTGDATLVRVNF